MVDLGVRLPFRSPLGVMFPVTLFLVACACCGRKAHELKERAGAVDRMPKLPRRTGESSSSSRGVRGESKSVEKALGAAAAHARIGCIGLGSSSRGLRGERKNDAKGDCASPGPFMFLPSPQKAEANPCGGSEDRRVQFMSGMVREKSRWSRASDASGSDFRFQKFTS
jgi:hypothetical protein